jgi:uncharacterized protein
MQRFGLAWILVLVAGLGNAAVAEMAAHPAPQLTVRGAALLEVLPDQVRMVLAVVSTAENAEVAMRHNSERMVQVEKALAKAGLQKGEGQTGRYQIYPEWSPRPRQVPDDWQPRIIGYRVENTLQLRSRQLNLAGRFIEAAIKAGADRVDSVVFDLADPRRDRSQAIAEATANARADAQALAEAAGVRLGKVLHLQLDDAALPPRPMEMMRDVARAAALSAAPELTPGVVQVAAGMTVTYRIEEH